VICGMRRIDSWVFVVDYRVGIYMNSSGTGKNQECIRVSGVASVSHHKIYV
jgi:hypothetical protein